MGLGDNLGNDEWGKEVPPPLPTHTHTQEGRKRGEA